MFITMSKTKLQSSDGEILEVDRDITKQSSLLQSFIDAGTSEPIPLPKVEAAILKKVVEWCTYHKDDLHPVESNTTNVEPANDVNKCCAGVLGVCGKSVNISSWDAEFLNISQNTLFGLISAAEYLGIKDLVDITAQTIANMIKGKGPEEIRQLFNIRNDLTPAEEEQI